MIGEWTMTKREIRQDVKRRLADMPADVAAAKSRAACAALVSLPEFRSAGAVMLFLSMPDEIDTTTALLAAWEGEKIVLVPKVASNRRQMIPVECRTLDDHMAAGAYGIREPENTQPWPREEIDLVVVPGLAFDRTGSRLGRGGGYYDRFLGPHAPRTITCGLSFDEQLVGEVPADDHDRPVEILVTDKEVLRFDSRRRSLFGLEGRRSR